MRVSPPVDDVWFQIRKRIASGDGPPLSATDSPPPEIFPFYTPSFDLAVAGTLIFGILTLVHAYLAWRTKTALFIMCVYAGAGMLETSTQTVISDTN